MTRQEQIKILDDKIEANNAQYDLDRMNGELPAYSSGDLPKYEYITKKDLGYKPDAVEKVKFDYSAEDNLQDNLVEVDDNDNKVGIFRIIKDIKDRGIKIDNDDEAVREIRERIKELIDDGIKVNNFGEMKKEIIDHVKKLKEQGSDVKVDEDQINDLINKIFNKTYGKYERKTYIEAEIDNFLEKYGDKISLLVMVIIKINLIQKKLLNHLKNYVIN